MEEKRMMQAVEVDKTELLKLYKAQLGREFCAWDEHYPEMQDIEGDLSRNALFVMRNPQDEIIAAISLDEDENVEQLPFWTDALQPGGEVARLVVRADYQNQGIAREMIQYAMKVLKERGRKSIHYMVNKENLKAVRSYAHLNFKRVGECIMYDQPFWCYEQEL